MFKKVPPSGPVYFIIIKYRAEKESKSLLYSPCPIRTGPIKIH